MFDQDFQVAIMIRQITLVLEFISTALSDGYSSLLSLLKNGCIILKLLNRASMICTIDDFLSNPAKKYQWHSHSELSFNQLNVQFGSLASNSLPIVSLSQFTIKKYLETSLFFDKNCLKPEKLAVKVSLQVSKLLDKNRYTTFENSQSDLWSKLSLLTHLKLRSFVIQGEDTCGLTNVTPEPELIRGTLQESTWLRV